MKKVNTFVLSVTIAIIDYLYRGRHFQRFWVLEEIAHTLFCVFECLTFKRISRFAWSACILNERTLRNQSMKPNILNLWKVGWQCLLGGSLCRQTPRTCLLLDQCGLLLVAPMSAYHLSYEIEMHVAETYAKYLAYEDYNDKDIWRIMNDEIQHFQELADSMRILIRSLNCKRKGS